MSNAAPTTPVADPASLQPEPGLSFPKAPRLPRCAPVQGVPVSAASPIITVREVYTPQAVLYVANGPDGALSLLARESEEAALRDGREYFLRTREFNGSKWVLR